MKFDGTVNKWESFSLAMNSGGQQTCGYDKFVDIRGV